MYGDIVNSFKDKIIGTAVDNVVDTGVNNLRDKNTLANTYVWTCINKETHNGNVANLTFINKLGKRQRVPYDRLAQFCQMNYVSNVIVEDGKVKMQGCSLYDLPNFKLNSYGQYDLSAPHDENWVYQKAIPYIQSQERLIQEDFANGCLKTSKGNGVQTNASANISAVAGGISDVRGTAEAVAITAVTAAGAAAVTGTVVAGKAIFNQLNKKKLVEEQTKICTMLGKASDFIRVLTLAKHRTNAMYKNDKNLVAYNNEIEATNETTGKLTNELRSYGMNGCIQKMYGVINSAKARATSNKILDMKLNNANIGFGTLNAYIQNLENSLGELVKLHNETKALLDSNIAFKEELGKQKDIIKDLEYSINRWRSMINTLKSRELNVNTVHTVKTEFDSYNFYNIQSKLSEKLGKLLDQQEKIRLHTVCTELSAETIEFDTKLIDLIKEARYVILGEINEALNKSDEALDYLLNAVYNNSEKMEKIEVFRSNINDAKTKMLKLELTDKETISERIKSLEERMNKSKNDMDMRAKSNEKQLAEYNKVLAIVERRRSEIANAKDAKAINSFIEKFNSDINSILRFDLNNQTLVDKVKVLAEEVRTEFSLAYNNRVMEEDRVENEALQKINEVTQKILDKKIWLEQYNPSIITEQNLEEIKIPSLIDYRTGIKAPSYDSNLYQPYRDMSDRYDELSSVYINKKRKYKDIIDDEKRVTTNFKREINGVRSKIRRLEKAYEKVYIENNIENLKTDVDREKIQDTSWLDTEIELLSQEYQRKCVDICI